MTRFWVGLALSLAGALGVVGCSSSSDAETDSEDLSARSFKLATFNAGLVRGGVALADERLPLIPAALEKTNADVLCLQEVWTDEDYEQIRASLAAKYPHAFRQRTEENGHRWFSCNPFRLQSLKSCVDSQCTPTGVSAEECVQTTCKEQYDSLSDRCQLCLASNTDSPTKCLFRANDYVQGGRNGVALFSKTPITDARFEDFGTTLVHRGMIRATVAGKAIVCTHLSADLRTVPYPSGRRFSSWAEEQSTQVDQVVNALPQTGCRIALGDMNAGTASGELHAEVPETMGAFERKGFVERWSSPVCTWCAPPQNPLTSGREPRVIDHILLNGCGTRATYKRILDEPIQVEHDGQPLTTALSDHFGLMVTIDR